MPGGQGPNPPLVLEVAEVVVDVQLGVHKGHSTHLVVCVSLQLWFYGDLVLEGGMFHLMVPHNEICARRPR